MFGSQVLDTGIGLTFTIFVLAIAASGVLELGNRLLNTRSKDLEVALRSLLDGRSPKLSDRASDVWQAFTGTSVYQGMVATRGQVRPAYLSAKAFAEAVDELLRTPAKPAPPADTPVGLRQATLAIDDVTAGTQEFRAGLERWYDEAMAGLSARYRKQSSVWLFLIGLVLAAALNASVPHVAQELWRDSATRAVVVAAAQAVGPAPTGDASTSPAQTLAQVAATAEQLTTLGLPIGWSGASTPFDLAWWSVHLLGWLLTGALCSMGGPFWFDVLGRLTAIRSPRPPKAVDDKESATRMLVETRASPVEPGLVGLAAVQQAPVEQTVRGSLLTIMAPGHPKKE